MFVGNQASEAGDGRRWRLILMAHVHVHVHIHIHIHKHIQIYGHLHLRLHEIIFVIIKRIIYTSSASYQNDNYKI